MKELMGRSVDLKDRYDVISLMPCFGSKLPKIRKVHVGTISF